MQGLSPFPAAALSTLQGLPPPDPWLLGLWGGRSGHGATLLLAVLPPASFW